MDYILAWWCVIWVIPCCMAVLLSDLASGVRFRRHLLDGRNRKRQYLATITGAVWILWGLHKLSEKYIQLSEDHYL